MLNKASTMILVPVDQEVTAETWHTGNTAPDADRIQIPSNPFAHLPRGRNRHENLHMIRSISMRLIS